jgi:hypothetical protein
MDKLTSTEIVERFLEFEEQSDRALEMVEADSAASPVLVAVVQELSRKAKKAHAPVTDGNAATMREAIIEVEQAADSAKVAAEADVGARDQTRQVVIDAHLTICLLKANM